MRYNNLGASGLMVSELSFGCMTVQSVEQCYAIMRTAFEGGGERASQSMWRAVLRCAVPRAVLCCAQFAAAAAVSWCVAVNFYDNAEGYGESGEAERIMGAAVARGIAEGVWERMDLVVSTKLFFGGRGARDTVNSAQNVSRKKLYEGLRASLERLALEYVDVVFCHRPDPTTPIEETVRGAAPSGSDLSLPSLPLLPWFAARL